MNTSIIAAMIAAAIAGITPALSCDVSVIQNIVVDGSFTGWSGVYLGMSRSELEAKVGHSLTLTEYAAEVGEPSSANVTFKGQRVVLMFRGEGSAAELQGLFLPFTELTQGCGRERLVGALKESVHDLEYDGKVPGLTEDDHDTPVYVRRAARDTAFLLKPSEGLYICRRGWIE